MNNSYLEPESETLTEQEVDRRPWLRERESELVRVIEAIKVIADTKEWGTLKNYVFDGVVEKLEKDLLTEAKKIDPDKQKLASVNGQFAWAKKYADLESLADVFRVELTQIRKQIKSYGREE